MRDFQTPGRSPVHAVRGMVATSHPLASEAGAAALRAGGNAVDAALAASAVLAVVEPHMTGIGGDCFALVAEPDGALTGINGSGRSAASLEPGMANGAPLPERSPLGVTVPGAVAAWEHLAERGGLGLAAALRPAILLAREGFPVAPRVALDWAAARGRLASDMGAARHYLRDGAAPDPGDLWRLPALAETLEDIARDGAHGFYAGRAGEEIVATLAARAGDASSGGTLSGADLAAHATEEVEPLARTYRDVEVVELPPANQGVTALAMLGVLERFDVAAMAPGGPEHLHLEIEASRLAYAERDGELADAAAMRVGADALLAAGRLDALAARISPTSAMEPPAPAGMGTDTVYLCAVDGEGRAVSFINSLFHAFGSGICTPGTGVMLQNRGCGFAGDPSHPNGVGPRKRPLHTLIPGMLMREGLPVAAFGVMGGQYQAHGHAHLLSLMIDHGLDPQAALDAPRVFHEGADVLVETGVPEPTFRALTERGHRARRAGAPLGGGQAIAIDRARGVLIGGSDPRKDGCAIGLA